MVKKRPIKNRRGLSAIIGYVLLVTFGLIMAVIAYSYLKTYVPKDLAECPDGTSIFVKDYDCSDGVLTILLKNSGRFNYAGYYIHAANNTSQKVATINLAEGFINSSDPDARVIQKSYILFSLSDENKMVPKKEITHQFNLDNDIEILEITPVRFQEEGATKRFVSCSSSKTREEIVCN